MNRAILIAACVTTISIFSAAGASAQTSGPAGQQTVKTDTLMNSQARMMRKHHMMRRHMMRRGMRMDPSKRGGQPKSGTQGGH